MRSCLQIRFATGGCVYGRRTRTSAREQQTVTNGVVVPSTLIQPGIIGSSVLFHRDFAILAMTLGRRVELAQKRRLDTLCPAQPYARGWALFHPHMHLHGAVGIVSWRLQNLLGPGRRHCCEIILHRVRPLVFFFLELEGITVMLLCRSRLPSQACAAPSLTGRNAPIAGSAHVRFGTEDTSGAAPVFGLRFEVVGGTKEFALELSLVPQSFLYGRDSFCFRQQWLFQHQSGFSDGGRSPAPDQETRT